MSVGGSEKREGKAAYKDKEGRVSVCDKDCVSDAPTYLISQS